MYICYNSNLNYIASGLNFNDSYVDTFLRFNYLNHGISYLNYYYEEIFIKLNSKFSSKNISDYYKGFSVIENGLYKNHIVDPSSLHIWDSTFESDSEVLNIRKKILSSINAEFEDYKIYLPITFDNSIYCYIQVGKNLAPTLADLICFQDSKNSADSLFNLNITYPKIDYDLSLNDWHERHFPIYINPEIYKNPSNTDFAKLIYFYYQRQNPYIEKKYILSQSENLFCDFYFADFESTNKFTNKYAIFHYGIHSNFECFSNLNSFSIGSYTGLSGYSGELIGNFSSKRCFEDLNLFNNIYTSIDKNYNIFDFQTCLIEYETIFNINFCFCKNNFFTCSNPDVKNYSNIWYKDTADYFQQFNGLPNLDIYQPNNLNPFVSSDYFNIIKCKNVII